MGPDQLWTAFGELYHPSLTIGDVEEEAQHGDRGHLSRDFLIEVIKEDAQKAYDHREGRTHPEVVRELERRVGCRCSTASGASTLRDGLPAGGHRAAGNAQRDPG
jgi:hypothetical protein